MSQEDMIKIIEKLEKKKGKKEAVLEVGSVLDSLPSVYVELKSSPVSVDISEGFRASFSRLLVNEDNLGGLRAYVGKCSNYAERGRLDGFEVACWMRSVLQILDDEFMDWDSVGPTSVEVTFHEDLEDIDEIIKDVSDEAPPVRSSDIPDWVPEGYWWWSSPVRQDMSEEEKRTRLEYDHLDGVYDE
ncbi:MULTISPECIES: hypothetical protein [Nocardiopsidaceae]|uniref:Uncharacterized protein n=2 Tax=Nocardiopsidaceae TaxID=83676 RepID=A0ABY6YFC0_9ACTN|nr:hypothetical protein [Streptomonospora nanhaiensis]MEE2042503.1 hypothetical protein [Nocardiopsis tropica]WAE70942.1 hypothetical protein OUQ99_17025 [Streptomonospora nanhaiensis]